MAVGDQFMVSIMGHLHGQQIVNTFFYHETTNSVAGGQNALAIAVDGTLGLAIRNAASNEYTYDGTLVQQIFPLPPRFPTFVTTNNGVGGVSANSLPCTVAAVVRKRSAMAGRRYRGRAYLAGVPATYETDSTINATGITGYAPVLAAVGQTQTSSPGVWVPAILHRDGTHTYVDINTVSLDTILRVQRRREIGKGS